MNDIIVTLSIHICTLINVMVYLNAHTGIQAFPTFRIYLNSSLLEEFRGANMQALEAAVVRHKASVQPVFSGSGHSLAGATPVDPNEDPRVARLRRLGLPVDDIPASRPATNNAPAPAPAPQPMDIGSVSSSSPLCIDRGIRSADITV